MRFFKIILKPFFFCCSIGLSNPFKFTGYIVNNTY